MIMPHAKSSTLSGRTSLHTTKTSQRACFSGARVDEIKHETLIINIGNAERLSKYEH